MASNWFYKIIYYKDMEKVFHIETTTNGQKYLYCYEENYQYPYSGSTGDVKVYIINPDLSEEI